VNNIFIYVKIKLLFLNVASLQFLMYINKNVFKSNKFKNEYVYYSGFLHTSIRSYSVNHKIRNGIGKVFNLDNILKSNLDAES